MIQPKKPTIIRVLRSHSHQYFTSSIKKRRSNNVIHMTIGIPKLVHSTNNNLHSVGFFLFLKTSFFLIN